MLLKLFSRSASLTFMPGCKKRARFQKKKKIARATTYFCSRFQGFQSEWSAQLTTFNAMARQPHYTFHFSQVFSLCGQLSSLLLMPWQGRNIVERPSGGKQYTDSSCIRKKREMKSKPEALDGMLDLSKVL